MGGSEGGVRLWPVINPLAEWDERDDLGSSRNGGGTRIMVNRIIVLGLVCLAALPVLAGCASAPEKPDPDWLNQAFTAHAKWARAQALKTAPPRD